MLDKSNPAVPLYNVMYIDLNADGNLTDPNERLTESAEGEESDQHGAEQSEAPSEGAQLDVCGHRWLIPGKRGRGAVHAGRCDCLAEALGELL